MIARRRAAGDALARIFLDRIERFLLTASAVHPAAETPRVSRPRLGGISFLHRFGSALDHHVHLHACVTEGVFVPAGDGPPAFLPARPITQADLATLTEKVRRRVVRWFRMQRLLDAAAAADMRAWDNGGFSVEASVRITLIDRDVPGSFRSLDHLLRYCARTPFALERLSVICGPDGRIARVRHLLPRHKAANWVGPGRSRKSARPNAHGVVELSPSEFLDRLADLVPPPRKHRHRYHGVFAPNHKLRRAVTALAIGNLGKRRKASAGGHGDDGHGAGGCCDTHQKPRSHDASPDCLGETPGPGGGEVSARLPELRRRHPPDRVHHPAGADPEDPHARVASYRVANLWRLRPSRRPADRPPTGASLFRPATTATSFKPRPKTFP